MNTVRALGQLEGLIVYVRIFKNYELSSQTRLHKDCSFRSISGL